MVAQITAGDSEIGADAEADHEEYMVKIQNMVEDAPSMDAIIAVKYTNTHTKERQLQITHAGQCSMHIYYKKGRIRCPIIWCACVYARAGAQTRQLCVCVCVCVCHGVYV